MRIGVDPIVAVNAIIEEGAARRLSLTHLQVQKVLYFAHAMCLVEARRPLIDGEFEAWKHGPVCREVYSELRRFGSEPIERPLSIVDPISGVEIQTDDVLDSELATIVARCVEFFGRFSAGKLVDLSHARNGPWDFVVREAESSVNIGLRIEDEVIVQRYRHHWLRSDPEDEKEIWDEDSPFAAN